MNYGVLIPGANGDGGVLEVMAPYDGSKIGTVETVGADGVERALQNAFALFRNRSGWLSPAKRIEILESTARILGEQRHELALAAAREGGKPLRDSEIEVERAIEDLKGCVDCLRTEGGHEVPMNLNETSGQHLAFTHREPIGVVVAVSAFNHPVNLILHQVGPAIAAGCPVIVKPAGDTPLCCFRIVEILREAGLPDAWCQPIAVQDRELATRLVTDSRVAFFSFIGSARVGWSLRSQLAPGTRCALEHGGVAPVIVAADADLDDAIPLLTKGGFYHAGQVCISVQRIFAHASIAENLASRLADSARALQVGDPTQTATDVGPLIRPREVNRIAEWVQEARDGGSQVLAGGEQLSESCYAPTVLFDPPANAKVLTQEIFGPVVCVIPFTDLDEAIHRANALPFAFQAAVFTRDIDTALSVYRRIDASAVMVNEHTAFRVDWMPFAGLRESGLGVGGIPYTFREMQIEKMIVIRSKAL